MLKSNPISEVTLENVTGVCCLIHVKILALRSSWQTVGEAKCKHGVGAQTRI